MNSQVLKDKKKSLKCMAFVSVKNERQTVIVTFIIRHVINVFIIQFHELTVLNLEYLQATEQGSFELHSLLTFRLNRTFSCRELHD